MTFSKSGQLNAISHARVSSLLMKEVCFPDFWLRFDGNAWAMMTRNRRLNWNSPREFSLPVFFRALGVALGDERRSAFALQELTAPKSSAAKASIWPDFLGVVLADGMFGCSSFNSAGVGLGWEKYSISRIAMAVGAHTDCENVEGLECLRGLAIKGANGHTPHERKHLSLSLYVAGKELSRYANFIPIIS